MFSRIILLLITVITVFCLGFIYCKNRNLIQKVKEISYVKDKEIEILSIPNAGKSDLLNLMYLNKL